ncbi:zinc-ribbon domain-containing protein [Pseudodesulfovibrio sp. zrk46]|uniref:zinc-ribbon domain-containing protein n=1 Tax=Pseudodesulfovibrio sp. zrk46 TaxID=2725288 RepID=UPI001449B74E|nr:zinc-ribbon domain-containing protein [Pseudodesulfovibrio sp. zrk46]QJB55163.1 zinc-ribbon domain-containing protein [Pseudodesulfovibrio sp. zrk46]
MIVCTGCGRKNDDESRFCAKCGKKLQSSRQAMAPSAPEQTRLTRFAHKGLPKDRMMSLRRLLEAFACLCLFVAVGAYCLYFEDWLPMYPTLGLIGLLLWFRKL